MVDADVRCVSSLCSRSVAAAVPPNGQISRERACGDVLDPLCPRTVGKVVSAGGSVGVWGVVAVAEGGRAVIEDTGFVIPLF